MNFSPLLTTISPSGIEPGTPSSASATLPNLGRGLPLPTHSPAQDPSHFLTME